MRKGELADAALPELLDRLAAESATGCVHVRSPHGRAQVQLRDGVVCGCSGTPLSRALGERLVASGSLTRDGLAEAELVGRSELAGWPLSELLVHLDLAGADVVREQAHDLLVEAVREVAAWTQGSWLFRPDEHARADVAAAVTVGELLDGVVRRSTDSAGPVPALQPDPASEPDPAPQPDAAPQPDPKKGPDPTPRPDLTTRPTAVEDAEALAAAHAELRAALAGSSAEPVTETGPTPEPEPEPHVREPTGRAEDEGQDGAYLDRSDTDTAALLRELSSLGADEEPEPGPTPAVPPRPLSPAQAAQNRRKKGLFGR